MRTRPELVASIGVVFSGCLWGAFWIPVRQVEAAGVSGAWATLAFFVPLVAILAPFTFANRRAVRRSLATLLPAGLFTGAAFALYSTGLLLSDVVRVILLFYLTPVWGTLLARWMIGEPITRTRTVSLVVGLLGLFVILGAGPGIALPRNAGDWMGLLAGVSWAAGTLYVYRGTEDRPVDLVFMLCAAGAATSVVLLALPVEGHQAAPSLSIVGGALGWIAVVAFGFTLPTILITLWAAKRLDPGRVGLLLMSEVLVGVVTAAIWSGEPFGVREVIGAALVMAAGFIEVMPRRRSASSADGLQG